MNIRWSRICSSVAAISISLAPVKFKEKEKELQLSKNLVRKMDEQMESEKENWVKCETEITC